MNWVNILFHTIGGLALFLYGMDVLSKGLKSSAGNRIRNILSHLTRHRLTALLVGTAVTMIIQSSSATTVMAVGFVNAGLISFRQAVPLELGASIGTTITAWIVSLVGKFDIAVYALPSIGLGFVLIQFVRSRKMKQFGEVVLGFGLLFFGLDIMKNSFEPLRESGAVMSFFATFSRNPILGVLAGTLVTMVLQSSSATIAIVQTLAFNGVIGFDAAIPLVLGDNIGTTITANLAAIGASTEAVRTARAHALCKILGTCLILPFVWLGLFGRLVDFLLPGEISRPNIMMHIAFAHSLFNVINASVFTIFLDFVIRLTTALVPSTHESPVWAPMYLKESFLTDPLAAMQQVIKELVRMAELARLTVKEAQEGFFNNDETQLRKASRNEDDLDNFQRSITRYLIGISERHLDTRESMEYPVLLHSVNDLEKIGDYAKNIVNYANLKIDNRLELQQEGVEEITLMFNKLYELFDKVIEALQKRDGQLAAQAIPIEDEIDLRKAQVRKNHIRRLNENTGRPEAELLVMDLANNIEKMGDHLISIAKAVAKDLQWGKKVELYSWGTAAASVEVDENEREVEQEPV